MSEQNIPTTYGGYKPLSAGAVAQIIDQYTIVINLGSQSGVRLGKRFLVYGIGPEIKDPTTNQSLGQLELVRGTGVISHIQEKMATLTSDMQRNNRKVIRKTSTNELTRAFGGSHVVEEEVANPERIPFDDPAIGDLIKPL